MVTISPQKLTGPWTVGYTLDVHTIQSDYIGDDEYGHPQFDTKRSEMGELLYRLKYRSDKSVISIIVETVVDFIHKQKWQVDLVVPVPPSRGSRTFQPVVVISKFIAKSLDVEFCGDCIIKVRETPELKNIYDFNKRLEVLDKAYSVVRSKLDSQRVLVIDDLYRSGATLNCVAKALTDKGNTKNIYTLTLTKSRSIR